MPEEKIEPPASIAAEAAGSIGMNQIFVALGSAGTAPNGDPAQQGCLAAARRSMLCAPSIIHIFPVCLC